FTSYKGFTLGPISREPDLSSRATERLRLLVSGFFNAMGLFSVSNGLTLRGLILEGDGLLDRDGDLLWFCFLPFGERDRKHTVFVSGADFVGLHVFGNGDRAAEREALFILPVALFAIRRFARPGDGQVILDHFHVDIRTVDTWELGANVGVVLV